MFYFNPDKYDFWKIYDSIKIFYPIGVRQDKSKMFYSYPGLKGLEPIIVDNIHEEENFKTRWVDFTKEMENNIQKTIIGQDRNEIKIGKSIFRSRYMLTQGTAL